MVKILRALLPFLFSMSCLAADEIVVCEYAPIKFKPGMFDVSQGDTLGLKEADGSETITVFRPERETDMRFNNHPQLIVFKEKLYATWVGHPVHEVSDKAYVFYSCSVDGHKWTEPVRVGPELRASGGWLSDGNHLSCLLIKADKELKGEHKVESPDTEYCLSRDGLIWSEAQVLIDNAMPSESARRTSTGRYIMTCHGLGKGDYSDVRVTRVMYTDDPAGLTGWQEGQLPRLLPVNISDSKKVARAVESSWYERRDGSLVMLFRSLDFNAKTRPWRVLAAESFDNGTTWSKPVLTDMVDSDSMQCAGSLPDGTVYMINNPVEGRRRVPLAITVSDDGKYFDRSYLVRGTPQERRYEGISKTLGYSYPGRAVWKDYIWISYATNKEDIEITRIPLKSLKKVQ